MRRASRPWLKLLAKGRNQTRTSKGIVIAEIPNQPLDATRHTRGRLRLQGGPRPAVRQIVNFCPVGPVVQSGQARGPVKAEIAGSNPVGTASLRPGGRGEVAEPG